MLILIGIVPAHYAVNGNLDLAQINGTVAQVQQMDVLVGRFGMSEDAATIQQELRQIGATLSNKRRLTDLSAQERSALRSSILDVDKKLGEFAVTQGASLSVQDRAILKTGRAQLRKVIDFVVTWVVIAVALALGIGTTVGLETNCCDGWRKDWQDPSHLRAGRFSRIGGDVNDCGRRSSGLARQYDPRVVIGRCWNHGCQPVGTSTENGTSDRCGVGADSSSHHAPFRHLVLHHCPKLNERNQQTGDRSAPPGESASQVGIETCLDSPSAIPP